ncbi:MAG: mercury(II) reductase, partial [Gemmatimonadota bacterium]
APTRPGPARTGADGDGRPPHLVVIGGGSGAFAAAIRAAELGARVTMVERGLMGGTCTNRGCVPSKTLIRAAEIHHLRHAHPFSGVPRADGRVEIGALVEQKRELVERLRASKYADVLAAYPRIEYVEGEARFTARRSIAVVAAGGETRELRPDRVIVATGARPWRPDLPGLDELPTERVWTNEEALEAEEIPERLVVAGGGPVGIELAQLFSRLGSRVTLVAPTLVPGAESELTEALADYLRQEGVSVETGGARLRRVKAEEGGHVAVVGAGNRERSVPFDRLLLATGRTANTEVLGLDAAGIETVGRGFIPVDDGLRTAAPHVYAVGDCTDRPQFVYVAARAGAIAAENALGSGDARLDLSAMPAVIFTDPQLAWVGLSEAEAGSRGEAVEARTLPLEHVPRALVNRDTRGLIRLVARKGDGRLLGVHVLSPHAGEVVQTGVLGVRYGLSVDDLTDTLFPYLTEVEGLKLAAQSFSRDVATLSCCAG